MKALCYDRDGKLIHEDPDLLGGSAYVCVLRNAAVQSVSDFRDGLSRGETVEVYCDMVPLESDPATWVYRESKRRTVKSLQWREFEKCSHGLHPVLRTERKAGEWVPVAVKEER